MPAPPPTQQQAGDTNTPVTSAQPVLVTGLDQACSGAQCSAATSAAFSGAGTGIWGHTAGGASEDVQFSISGLAGTSISLLLTNLNNTLALLPSGLSASMLDATTVTRLSPQALSADAEAEARRREIAEFNRTGWAEKVAAAQPLRQTLGVPAPHAVAIPGVGATKSWYHTDGSTRPATLRKQMTATDGTIVNVWVEDSQYNIVNGIDSTIVDDLGAAFAGTGKIYDLLTGIGGAVWGANTHPDTVLPAGQPIDIVILNFDGNGAPGGTVGYFWGLHNLLKTARFAQQRVDFAVPGQRDAGLGGATGMKAMKMTMAHEGTHMQNFYRRAVKMGTAYAYDDWLEEMTAMQMEDFLSFSIDPTYNAIRDVRFPDFYRYSGFNCPLLTFTGGGTCESYSVSGSFGGFLDRQLGLPFYKDLLTRQVVGSKTVLDQAIQAAQPGLTFNLALTRWAATNGSGMPAGQGADRLRLSAMDRRHLRAAGDRPGLHRQCRAAQAAGVGAELPAGPRHAAAEAHGHHRWRLQRQGAPAGRRDAVRRRLLTGPAGPIALPASCLLLIAGCPGTPLRRSARFPSARRRSPAAR